MSARATPLNIVALAPNPWDGQWVNRQHLLSRLGRRHRIVYSNGAWSMWDRSDADFMASDWFGRFDQVDQVSVDRPGRNLLRWPRVQAWDELAIRIHVRRLKAQFSTPAPLVAYLCHPRYWPYVRALRPDYVVYHCYDLYSHQPDWSEQLDTAERALLSRADLVFSASSIMTETLISRVAREVRTLTNGADVQSIFDAAARAVPAPEDLAEIPQPRIGYVGSLHPQIDFELLAALAQRRPRWHFVLVGPEQRASDLHADLGYQCCRTLPNVHFLGERSRHQIPAYLIHMQVNTMLYRLSSESWTNAGFPLKLYEYLACGLPVVSVELPTIQEFDGLVRFARGVEAWDSVLASVLVGEAAGTAQHRHEVAARNGWPARAHQLAAWLDELPTLRRQRLQQSGDSPRRN